MEETALIGPRLLRTGLLLALVCALVCALAVASVTRAGDLLHRVLR